MINPNELRIGNYVQALMDIEPKKELFIDRVLHFDNEKLYCGMSEAPTDWYDPIPLTEAWFLKFNLMSVALGYYRLTDSIIINVDGQVYFESEYGDSTHWIAECHKVHTFQNLVFDLTSEELTIQP